jgi:hypothetical protein
MAARTRKPAVGMAAVQGATTIAASQAVTPDVPIFQPSDPANATLAAEDARKNAASGGTASTAPKVNPFASIDDEVRAEVLALYGPAMNAALMNPEVFGLFKSMYADGSIKNANLVALRLQATQFYRNQTTSQRSTTQLESENPAEAIRQFNDVQRSIQRTAQRYGVQLDPATIGQLANDAWRNGWANDTDRMQQAILGHADLSKGLGQGSIAGTAASIRSKMKKYGLPASDASVAQWSMQIAQGTLDPDALNEMIMSQAKAKYPHLADMIDKGLTPDDYYQPFKQTLASELELNPEDINFDSPEWSPVIDGGGTGKPMTLTETRRFARTKDAWRKTDAANRQAADVERFILRTFGQVA